jgi:hypothetical protein
MTNTKKQTQLISVVNFKRYCQRKGCKKTLSMDSRSDAKFCSDECRMAHYNESHPRLPDTPKGNIISFADFDLIAIYGKDAISRAQHYYLNRK